jgi:hypothetical protein
MRKHPAGGKMLDVAVAHTKRITTVSLSKGNDSETGCLAAAWGRPSQDSSSHPHRLTTTPLKATHPPTHSPTHSLSPALNQSW